MEGKFLTEVEILQIELGEHRAQIEALKLEIAKLRQQAMQLKAKNFELIEELKGHEVRDAESTVSATRRKHMEFMSGLKEKYEIGTATWGYNPHSGEIIPGGK